MDRLIKKIMMVILLSVFTVSTVRASEPQPISGEYVSQTRMQQVYEAVRTPFKFGLVLAPERNDYKIDCPTVFREGDRWYMTYLLYNGKEGKDGRGYETWLAESPDLLQWKTMGKILSFRDKGWDNNQRGGYMALIDNRWGGSYTVSTYKGKYWMTYIGGDTPGYEQGILNIGIANTERPVNVAHEWNTFEKPVLSPKDTGNGWWESLTQYKSSVFWDKNKRLGTPFVMFYNAGGINPETRVKGERIGIALSEDMKKWVRYSGNPVINHEGGITGDAVIQQMDDLYVLFYFSAFRPGVSWKAFNSFCCSYDLIHWTDWQGEKLINPSEPYDNQFAHKSCVINHNGVVYHFYCAVNKDNQRGIALATSTPMGSSTVRFPTPDRTGFRQEISLNGPWLSMLEKVEKPLGNTSDNWIPVIVPHNWDQYYGARQLKHGNLHGTAWYRKQFMTPGNLSGKRCFLFFEGVGSYATIYVNGKEVGSHKGGRTTFTVDVTGVLKPAGDNLLTVKAENPAMIADLPWICGGCSGEPGFSEGSQPLGLFRPVTLVVTDEVRVQPFGVHLWNEAGSIREEGATTQVQTTLKNYGNRFRNIELINKLIDEDGVQVARSVRKLELKPGEEITIHQLAELTKAPDRWSPESPCLYTMITMLKENGKVIDELKTPYGFRTISWPQTRNDGDHRFLINNKPLLINGVCEYEHQLGISQAFTDQQIEARIEQIRSAGFNAFRDAHQPHNLLYKDLLDKNGLLQWTQFSAHVWFDTPVFRETFKTLLREWVIERRNSPSIILWGLQNESSLPEEFARECTQLIRQLDPTTSSQRLVTTCNGGEGTDWDVVQNWSGTYSGDPNAYGRELSQQLLNGEYGTWRSIDLHTEGGFVQQGIQSEDRFCHLMEQKIGLAEHYQDSLCGQFLWLFNSHENPGRIQNEEGFRAIDRIGPYNYKGLFTPWGEPVDAYYLYRSNYAPKETEPMAYIVSHTWPDRWTTTGLKDSIIVYSNCDSAELFNDVNHCSLGTRVNKGKGTHFQWDGITVSYNVLQVVGYVNGRIAAKDYILLNHLPKSPHFDDLYYTPFQDDQLSLKPVSLKAQPDYLYLYRVNCGGPDYTDVHGQLWQADRTLTDSTCWGSLSWTDHFEGLHPYLASQRTTNDPIAGTTDWKLFQTFRYGTDKLTYCFPVKPGKYLVELYFTEPWYGAGGGMNCDGWRQFDIAVNGETVIRKLDIWREAGHDGALKKTVMVYVTGTKLELSFPNTTSGQAILSAIALATTDESARPASPSTGLILCTDTAGNQPDKSAYWLATGDKLYVLDTVFFSKLPPALYGAEWIRPHAGNTFRTCSLEIMQDASLYLAVLAGTIIPEGFEATTLTIENSRGEVYSLAVKPVAKGSTMCLEIPVSAILLAVPYIKTIQETTSRPDLRLEAEDAGYSGPVKKGLVYRDKACVAIEKPGKVCLEWLVTPGLAGVYNLRFRYRNVTDKPLNLRIQVLASDDRVLRDDIMTFPPASEKWRVISTTTEASINAGRYRVRLESEDATGLWMDSMDFQ